MATINQLSAVSSLSSGDLIAVNDNSEGDDRKASLSKLVTYLNGALSFPAPSFTTQRETVSATGYSVTAQDSGVWVWLFVNQGANYNAGTVVFPATPVDQQELMIKFSHELVAVTFDGNGNTVVNYPDDIGTSDVLEQWRFKYDSLTETWYGF